MLDETFEEKIHLLKNFPKAKTQMELHAILYISIESSFALLLACSKKYVLDSINIENILTAHLDNSNSSIFV